MRCDNAALTAVASRSPERLDEFQNLFGPFGRHEDYAALIEDPGVDALYIPLPNTLHCEWTLRALRAGKRIVRKAAGAQRSGRRNDDPARPKKTASC